METLRSEIIESQKARNDLMKWKLLLVSGLGAAGLGFSNHSNNFSIELVLCCIPFVCAYVDLLCHHLNLRILVIGKFISLSPDDDQLTNCIADYEKFIDVTIRRSAKLTGRKIGAYDLENWALIGSSIILSLGLIAYALCPWVKTKTPLIGSGILGILASIVIQKFADDRRKKIENIKKSGLVP